MVKRKNGFLASQKNRGKPDCNSSINLNMEKVRAIS